MRIRRHSHHDELGACNGLSNLICPDKYKSVNQAILGAFGINSSVSTGADNSISFGTSQISTRLVSLRINAAKRSLCKLVNKIMRGVNGSPYGLPRSNDKKIPTFCMPESDLTQVAAFQKECMNLYEKGLLSVETLLNSYNIDIETEFKRKQKEIEEGKAAVFVQSGSETKESNDDNNDSTVGRPTLDDADRESDPGNSETGRAPKPSNEDGSEKQE